MGAYGEVRSGEYTAPGGQQRPVAVAVKVFPVCLEELGGTDIKAIMSEITTMHKFAALRGTEEGAHRLLQLLGYSTLPKLCIVTPLMLYGSLAKVLQSHEKHPLSWRWRLACARDVASGMNFLHQHSVIHRDLKSGNVLVDAHFAVHIGDFGLAVASQASRSSTRGAAGSGKGTIQYMAPELLSARPKYSEMSDLYSFGILVWELLTRLKPWADVADDILVKDFVKDGERPDFDAVDLSSPDARLLRAQAEVAWHQTPANRKDFAYHFKTFDKEVRSFDTSNFLKHYLSAKARAEAIERPDEVWTLLSSFGAALGFQTTDWHEFIGGVRGQVEEYMQSHQELVPTPELILILAWSSQHTFRPAKLPWYSVFNRILREDQEGKGIELAALGHRILSRYLVTRSSSPAKWPEDNKCFRGTSMPLDFFESFFFVGLIYRVPFILSFSFDHRVAQQFADNSARESGDNFPIVFHEEFDTDVAFPYCHHVNC